MSYTQVPIPNLAIGESALLLTGASDGEHDLVAIRCERSEAEGGNLRYKVTARAIDSVGATLCSVTGRTVSSVLSHTLPATVMGMDALTSCIAAVLGEPQSIWDADVHSEFLRSVSIRNALATAKAAGPVLDLSAALGGVQ